MFVEETVAHARIVWVFPTVPQHTINAMYAMEMIHRVHVSTTNVTFATAIHRRVSIVHLFPTVLLHTINVMYATVMDQHVSIVLV
jgi:hypothetical protein